MQKILISNAGIEAVILPDYGGMVSELRVNGVNTLRMYYGKLGLSNVLSGGIPLMFPFSSRCKDDEAVFEGQTYPMPMHGFVKDLPFTVRRKWEQGCELSLESSAHTLHFYPYDFELTVIYEVTENALKTTLKLHNHSDKRMPFAMGTHPYFMSRDHSKTEFSFGLKEYDCYLEPEVKHGFVETPVFLGDTHDTVFWNGSAECRMNELQEGYRVRIVGDESFNVITICTWQDEAICIEPWQGKPDAPNHPDECLWLNPGCSNSFTYDLILETI